MATVESTMKTGASKARAGKGKTTTPSEQRLKRAQRASFLMKQMSDPTRLQIILMLSQGERHVGALCADLSQSQPATSHHLALLRHGGIISPRRHGKNNYYALTEMGCELARVAQAIMD